MSLAPIINTLKKHAGAGAGADRDLLGALRTEELVEIANSVLNYETGALSAIRTVGDLISSYSKESGEPDRNGSGWAVNHLAEALDAVLDLKYSVIDSLNKRGLDQLGHPLKGVGRG